MFQPTAYCAAGAPSLSPLLVLEDVEGAKNFYHRAFGLSKDQVLLHDDGRLAAAEMGWPGGKLVLLSPQFAGRYLPGAATPSVRALIRLSCDDVDGLFAHAVAAGATAVNPPVDQFWGVRHCILGDPYGHLWVFAKEGGEFRPPAGGI